MQHRDYTIIKKILTEINIGSNMIQNLELTEFLKDETVKRAVAMTVINIGELVKNITEETKLKYTDVKWKAIAGMRDITAHKYQTLRMEDVYYTMKLDLMELEEQLNLILDKEKE